MSETNNDTRPATDAELAEIRERWAKATPGPWERDYGGTMGHIKSTTKAGTVATPTVCRYDIWHPFGIEDHDGLYPITQQEADGDAIANAPTDIAKLLARVDAAEAKVADQRREIAQLRSGKGHAEQELNVMRAREMNLDDIADYVDELADLRQRLAAYEQPDDDEPVTEEWLLEIGFDDDPAEDGDLLIKLPGVTVRWVKFDDAEPEMWVGAAIDGGPLNKPNRRQVRRLIAALNGELK